MVQLDALTAEYGLMIRAIEMLHALGVLEAEFVGHRILVLILKIEIAFCQLLVLLDDLVQDVDIQRQALRRVQVLYQLAAYWTANAILMMQLTNAVGAERVPTVHKDPGDALAHVVLEPAKLADVEATRLVIQCDDVHLLLYSYCSIAIVHYLAVVHIFLI